MWKLIKEPKISIEKTCNECGELIETFDLTHPLTQYMIFDLQAHIPGKVDLNTLDFGLQPYHWCPIKPDGKHCLVPLQTTLRETQQEQDQEQERQIKTMMTALEEEKKEVVVLVDGHAPYNKKQPTSSQHRNHDGRYSSSSSSSSRGRPPKTAYETIQKLSLDEVDEVLSKKDDSANSV